MIKLTEDQIKTAIVQTWQGTSDYMLEKFFPRIAKIADQELLPEGLVSATLLAVDDVFFDGYSLVVPILVYMSIPSFFKNLELGEAGDKAIALFNEAIKQQN